MAKGASIHFERCLLESQAFMDLGTATAHKVLATFWIRRQMYKAGRSGKKQWVISNNGEITFTYEEAKKKLHISFSTFRNAIDELREKGYIVGYTPVSL